MINATPFKQVDLVMWGGKIGVACPRAVCRGLVLGRNGVAMQKKVNFMGIETSGLKMQSYCQ